MKGAASMPILDDRPGAAPQPLRDPARPLLRYLATRLGQPRLAFADQPRRLQGGVEASVLAFRLAHAPPPFDGPLVLRRFRPGHAGERAPAEAGIHDAARAAGLPVPRCLLHEADREVLGGAFVIVEQCEGVSPLAPLAAQAVESGLGPLALTRSLLSVPRMWVRIPPQLVEAALAVASVDAEAVAAAVRKRGGRADFLTVEERLLRIERRVEKYELHDVLAPSLDWLGVHRAPAPSERCLVHGDLSPTNLLVRRGRIVGLLDWSKALLAEPEAEVGFLRVALRTAAFSGLGSWNAALHGPLSWLADRITARYAATRPLDLDRVRWYEVLRGVGLLASMAKRAKPSKPRRHLLDSTAAARLVRSELARLTADA